MIPAVPTHFREVSSLHMVPIKIAVESAHPASINRRMIMMIMKNVCRRGSHTNSIELYSLKMLIDVVVTGLDLKGWHFVLMVDVLKLEGLWFHYTRL